MGDDRDDVELVRMCLAGGEQACEVLLTRYQAAVYRGVYRILHDPEEARDVTQDVLLEAYRGLASFDPHHRFFSWLHRIAVNEAINRRTRRRPAGQLPAGATDPGPSPNRTAQAAEAARHLEDALMELDVDQLVPIVLRHVLGCSYEEISEILGVPVKTVRSRLFRGRRALSAELERRGVTP